jgi:hypothetical protein
MVSKRLSTLEGRAGVRLIHRSTRALSPTEEGVRRPKPVLAARFAWFRYVGNKQMNCVI